MALGLKGAGAVSAGILGSRIVGFLRESLFAHYFGNTDAADAFRAALRIPNLLQNLFGEGVLSASFIPVYSRLRAENQTVEAELVSRSVFLALAALSSITAALGIIFTPELIDFITPGFHGEKRELAIQLVRILFPGTALLVLSAWCLGVQNSHRKFLLSYSAPILWNGAIIAALLLYGGREQGEAIRLITWAVTIGSALQLLVQLPTAIRLSGSVIGTIALASSHVRQVFRNFVPVVLSRGVVQISAFVDSIIASLLAAGSLSALSYAQTLYLLPVSVFGMSVSAAALPELSSLTDDALTEFHTKLNAGIRRILFFILPSAAAFLLIGDRLIGLVFQSGEFSAGDTALVWSALAVLAFGLPCSTVSRLLSQYFYSRNQAVKLLRISLLRVLLSSALGMVLALHYGWGLAGLCLGTTFGAFLELFLLSGLLKRSTGSLPRLSIRTTAFGCSLIPLGFLARIASAGLDRISGALLAAGVFGAGTLLLAALIEREELGSVLKRRR